MFKFINRAGIALFFIVYLFSLSFAAEEITITTYYPSPYGSYNELATNKLAVDVTGVAVASEYAAMSNGDAHIGRSLIVGAGGTGFAFDELASPTGDGDVLIKGNVGIGTNNPNYKLHIDNAAGDSWLQFTDTSSGTATTDGFLVGANNSGAYLIQREDRFLRFRTNNTDQMTIDNAGNVGIGTTSPIANSKLHIANGRIYAIDSANSYMWAPYLGPGSLRAGVKGYVDAGGVPWTDAAGYLGYMDGNITTGVYGTVGYGLAPWTPAYAGYFNGPILVRRATQNVWPGGLTPSGVYIDVDPNGNPRIELRGAGTTPYVAFSNDTTSDHDVRLILTDNNRLDIEGGDINTTEGGYKDNNFCVAGLCASDIRLKKNVKPLSNALNKIVLLEPISFEYINLELGSGLQYGLNAQNVEKVIPEIVKTDEAGFKKVRYGLELQMHMLQAIRELKTENDALRAENIQFKEKISKIEEKIKHL